MTLAEWDGEPVEALAARWGVPRLEAWASIGSTNDRAAELARAGAAPYTVVVADVQTAGRGRRGGRWVSPAGSGLLMSVVLPPLPDAATHLPLVVGLAVAEGVERVAAGVEVLVKWPNDLLVGDRKLAGVLCERSGGVGVAGLGVNLRPPRGAGSGGVDGESISLEEVADKSFSRKEIAQSIAGRFEAMVGALGDSLTPEAHRGLELRDATRGRPLLADAVGVGTGAGIDERGALLLLREDGSVARVVSGGVTLR